MLLGVGPRFIVSHHMFIWYETDSGTAHTKQRHTQAKGCSERPRDYKYYTRHRPGSGPRLPTDAMDGHRPELRRVDASNPEKSAIFAG